ncbi:hypothetical protein F4775DRAFT_290670 [Biscogniauxia sp. FL1348]|nr:hypothetical protein F4775DRAFT_290670 [Biscogniauxia sp. FL1348]
MADVPPPPPSSTKRALPFKRTFKRRAPAESPGSNDDSLSLFSRAKEFFPSVLEDQQRRAREKAAKAKREEEESALREQILREEESAKKRRRVSLPDDEEKMQGSSDGKEDEHDNYDDEDDVFSDNPPKSRKGSRILPHTPTSHREKSVLSSSKEGSRAQRPHSRKSETPVIALDDDSDDDDGDSKSYTMSTSSAVQSNKKSGKTSAALLRERASGSDSDLEMWDENTNGRDQKENKGGEDEDEDDGAMYIKMAMERIERARQERMARETGGSGSGSGGTTVSDGALVELLVGSYLDFIRPISFKVRTRQPLKIMFDTWVEQQVKRRGVEARPMLQDMFFTWKGNRVYPHTTLETLGICPDADGRLYPAWRDKQDGFQNQKVYFEAWTKDLYDQYQREKEQKRRHELGEWNDDDDKAFGRSGGGGGDGAAESGAADEQPAEEKRVRVTFKAKDLPSKNATLRSNTTVAMMIKVFRKLAKVPPEQHIQLRFDGEVLDDDMTVEEADIGDLDSVEVHIR